MDTDKLGRGLKTPVIYMTGADKVLLLQKERLHLDLSEITEDTSNVEDMEDLG